MKKKKQFIMGKHSLLELMKKEQKRIEKVFTCKEDGELLQQIREKQIPLQKVTKDELFRLVDSDSHQNIVTQIRPRPELDIKDFLSQEKSISTVLMLDSIFDPQNLGALFRAAECFGVDALVWSKNRGSSITPVVSKVSSGASELIDKIIVSNLADSILKFQDAGFEAIIAHVSDASIPLNSFTFPQKSLIIMGSEGKGVQPLIQKRADHVVSIPMQGVLSSLNVSQAASIFLAQRFFSKKLLSPDAFDTFQLS